MSPRTGLDDCRPAVPPLPSTPHIFITNEADWENGKLRGNESSARASAGRSERAWVRTPRLLSANPAGGSPAGLPPSAVRRAPPAVRGPGGSPPARPPGSCPDGPARAHLGTHPRRAPVLLPPRPREPGCGLPRSFPASEEPRGRCARRLLPAGGTARGAPGAAGSGAAGLGGLPLAGRLQGARARPRPAAVPLPPAPWICAGRK